MTTETKHKPIYIKGLVLKKPAVLVDANEYEGMKETLEILLEDPGLSKRLEKAEKELKSGKTVSWAKLKHELKV
jgi:PHD/YefM family antitoxin component YafN of YafNO toxin-antitoxin module